MVTAYDFSNACPDCGGVGAAYIRPTQGKYDQDSANTSLSHTASLTYDALHRPLTSVATGNATHNLTFVYDRYGNMTCQVNGSTVGICVQYFFNTSANQISNTGYVYGGTGHLINDGTHTYQYDAEGRLISVDNGTTASYVYDALGQRVEKDVGGTYSEYVFNIQGQPVGINNRTNWVEDLSCPTL